MKAEESPDFPKNITSARLSRPNEHTLDSSSLVGSSSITPLLDSCTLAGCLYTWDWDSAFRKGILRTTKIFIYKWAMLYVRKADGSEAQAKLHPYRYYRGALLAGLV